MKKYTKDMFVLDKFDNNISNEWDIVSPSTIFKDEYKKDEAEKEIILSYANALNCISKSLLVQNHSDTSIMTFRTDSLTIPFMFLARHTIELSLKYLCNLLNIEYKPRHSLISLWNKFMDYFHKYEETKDNAFDNMKTLIIVLEDLDCDGSHSRYSKDNKGELYNNKPKFINVENINYVIQNIFIQLIDSIRIENKK